MIKEKRFRAEKYTKKIICKELFDKWKKQYPEYSHITLKEFRQYWRLISSKIREKVCNSSHGVKLPQYLGEFSLKYVLGVEKNINYLKSNQINEDVPNLNFITNGKMGKIVWSVAYARKLNKELPMIAFRGCRTFTQLAKNSFVDSSELYKIAKSSQLNVRAIKNKLNDNKS